MCVEDAEDGEVLVKALLRREGDGPAPAPAPAGDDAPAGAPGGVPARAEAAGRRRGVRRVAVRHREAGADRRGRARAAPRMLHAAQIGRWRYWTAACWARGDAGHCEQVPVYMVRYLGSCTECVVEDGVA